MSEIPDDIKVTARMLGASLGADLYPQLSEEVRRPIAFIIYETLSKALAAEREACATMADEVERRQDDDNGAANTGGAAQVAAAIRRGTP